MIVWKIFNINLQRHLTLYLEFTEKRWSVPEVLSSIVQTLVRVLFCPCGGPISYFEYLRQREIQRHWNEVRREHRINLELQSFPKIMGQLVTFISNSFSLSSPLSLAMLLRCCVCVSSEDPSFYQLCEGKEGGVSANDNDSLNTFIATAYRCLKWKFTMSKPFCVLSSKILAAIVQIYLKSLRVRNAGEVR